MTFCFDDGPDSFDLPGFADEEGTANDAHEFASHKLLLLPGAVGFHGLVVGVAQQGEIEVVFGPEQCLRFDGIGTCAEDSHFQLVELPFCVAKLGRLDGSTGSVGLGEEEKQDTFALEIFESDGLVFVGLEAERGGFVAYF